MVAGAFGPDSLSIGADHWRQVLHIHWHTKALSSNGSLSSAFAGRGLSKHAGLALDSVEWRAGGLAAALVISLMHSRTVDVNIRTA